MAIVKTSLFWIGIVIAVFGLLFLAQGMRWFPYPAESFMVGSQEWVTRGAGTAVLGLILIVIARKLKS